MSSKKDRLEDIVQWTDLLFFPFATLCSIVLLRWVSFPLAITGSTVLSLFIFALFESRRRGLKRFVLAILGAALVVFVLAVIQYWLL